MKKQGWENKLDAYLRKCKNKPFKRGRHDCVLFAAKAIKETTGKNFFKDYEGTYTNKKEAYETLDAMGIQDVEALATRFLGEPILKSFARRGDVVSFQADEGLSLAIVDMTGKRAAAVGVKEMDFIPMDRWLKGWAV